MSEKMFQAKLADAGQWKRILNALTPLIDEASFNVSQDGLKCRSMDPSHVAMVDLELPKTVFDEYECAEPVKICFNVAEALKLLRRIGAESLEITVDAKAAQMRMVLRGAYTRTFTIRTLEPWGEEAPQPKRDFTASARIVARTLRNILEDANLITDKVQIEASQDRLLFQGKEDLGEAKAELEKDSEDLLSLEVKEPSKATYSLAYLLDIVKAGTSVSDITRLNFSTEKPIRLDFELPHQGKLQYYLPPRIESV